MDYLAKLAEVNLHLDPQGLAEEGVTTDTPVTINLRNEIMLKSALNLILEPLHLSYVVKDEVLKITSEQMRDGQVYTVTYNVADLVMPIPNFVPSARWAWQARLHKARWPTWASAAACAVRLVDRHAAWPWWPAATASGNSAHDQPEPAGPDAPAAARRRRPAHEERRRRQPGRADSAAARRPTSTA